MQCKIYLFSLAVMLFPLPYSSAKPDVHENAATLEHVLTTPAPSGHDIVQFSKLLYSELGSSDVNKLAKDVKQEYAALDVNHELHDTLSALYETLLVDIDSSERYAKKMKTLLELLDSGESGGDPIPGMHVPE
jgi:hypothetical protein